VALRNSLEIQSLRLSSHVATLAPERTQPAVTTVTVAMAHLVGVLPLHPTAARAANHGKGVPSYGAHSLNRVDQRHAAAPALSMGWVEIAREVTVGGPGPGGGGGVGSAWGLPNSAHTATHISHTGIIIILTHAHARRMPHPYRDSTHWHGAAHATS
jgi:hypothetical protein